MFKLEYEPQDTFLHRMHELAKVMIMIFFGIMGTVWWDPILLTGLSVIAIFLIWRSKLPGTMRAMIAGITGLQIIGQVLLNFSWIFMTSAALFKRLPPELTQQVIIVFTPRGTPIFGYMALQVGNLIYLYSNMLHMFIPVSMMFIFMYTVNPSYLVRVMIRYKMPIMIVFPVQATFRFFPIFSTTLKHIIDAQTLRGWSWSSRNPITLIRKSAPLMYPIGRDFLKMLNEVTISASNRCFDSAMVMNPLYLKDPTLLEKVIIYSLIPIALFLWFVATSPIFGYFGNI